MNPTEYGLELMLEPTLWWRWQPSHFIDTIAECHPAVLLHRVHLPSHEGQDGSVARQFAKKGVYSLHDLGSTVGSVLIQASFQFTQPEGVDRAFWSV